MSTFKEANQARTSLKMTFSQHAWYQGSVVIPDEGDYCIVVSVSHMDNSIRKVIPIVHQGISIKVDVDHQVKPNNR